MMMNVWITKYALTMGILFKTAKPCGKTTMIQVGQTYFHGEGRDWHLTFASAQKKAEEMRKRKVTSLKKQLAKLETMTFDAPSGDEEK